ncbi:MAG TPA: hypothetical protein VNH83_28285 [Bryobacteraceae bacterium]|nr:hypothetical protein [Bryobacteraceae bacterium]
MNPQNLVISRLISEDPELYEDRYAVGGVLVSQTHTVATDSHMLIAVELEKPREGPDYILPANIYQLDEMSEVGPDGRVLANVKPYPNWRNVIPQGEGVGSVVLNIKLLANLCAVLDDVAGGNSAVRVFFYESDRPVKIVGRTEEGKEFIGLAMLMRDKKDDLTPVQSKFDELPDRYREALEKIVAKYDSDRDAGLADDEGDYGWQLTQIAREALESK